MKSDYIINDLIEKITSGKLSVSSRIPSETQLAIKYQCNRHTIRKVISHLIERSYLVKSIDGSTYVNEFKLISSSDELSKLLQVEVNSHVWLIKRVRYIESHPIHTEEIYMPYSLFPNLKTEDCESSLLSYIESQYDYKISHGIRTVSSIKLNKYDSDLLDLPNESVVMQIENIGYLTNSRVYEYSISKSRESKFQYYCRR
ncbi:GntR family transcriptional regulator [Clostridium sp. MF28]|uniref:GntR family transcriptional regulator n=1 Tax=Clostridium TaxID=1485 RepID=UPI000CF8BCF3|nr:MULTISPECIES: GntR family transcriptional regulator [Clostridium]AVK48474.1 GntR family transcriptional regulator [Clostridium sp. MF28]PSM58837.1 GntR family transcriptional regulator [Clostridium diolis]